MPKTDAERQQAWRDCRARLIATLKQENARLRDALTEAERLAACYTSFATSAWRHSRRAPVAGLPVQ